MLTIAAGAQTLKVTANGTTKAYSAADLTSSTPVLFSNGTTMTVGSDTYTISDITNAIITTSNSTADANTVNIVYNGASATVTTAGNVAAYVTATVSGAHVTIAQSNTDAVDGDEITYVLSGTTADGSLTLSGSYKCTVSLAGVTLTNPSGAAINITNSKRIQDHQHPDRRQRFAEGLHILERTAAAARQRHAQRGRQPETRHQVGIVYQD